MGIKISIVVPVYNTEKFLKRCLNSVIKQSLKEIEIIIVNDGSPDNSCKIIKEYEKKDNRIIVINKENGGLSSARNAGIEIAKGEYILHLDSDDWIEQEYLIDMYNKAKKDDLDIVVSDIIWDFDNGITEYKQDLIISDDEFITNREYLNLFFKGNIFPAVWNKLYKLNLYKKYRIEHPVKISLGEDLATTPLLASNANRIGKINKAYIHYIQNPKSITKENPTKKIYELIEAFKILEKRLSKDDLKNINLKKIMSLGILIFNSNYDLKDPFYNEALKYYSNLFEKPIEIVNYSKKIKIYYKILKMKPDIRTLKFICYVDRWGMKIKKIIHR